MNIQIAVQMTETEITELLGAGFQLDADTLHNLRCLANRVLQKRTHPLTREEIGALIPDAMKINGRLPDEEGQSDDLLNQTLSSDAAAELLNQMLSDPGPNLDDFLASCTQNVDDLLATTASDTSDFFRYQRLNEAKAAVSTLNEYDWMAFITWLKNEHIPARNQPPKPTPKKRRSKK